MRTLPRQRAVAEEVAEVLSIVHVLHDDPDSMAHWIACGRRLSLRAGGSPGPCPALDPVDHAAEHRVIDIRDRLNKPKN